MAVADNINQVLDAIREKKSVKKAIKKINQDNDTARKDETLINSVIYSLIGIFNAASTSAQQTNIELSGFVIEPKSVSPSQVGTLQDPRMFIELAEHNDKFNKMFTVRKQVSSFGNEQYVIQTRKEPLKF